MAMKVLPKGKVKKLFLVLCGVFLTVIVKNGLKSKSNFFTIQGVRRLDLTKGDVKTSFIRHLSGLRTLFDQQNETSTASFGQEKGSFTTSAELNKNPFTTSFANPLDGAIDRYFDKNSTTKWYFIPREMPVYNYNYPFIERSTQICNGNEKPYLIILCLTQYDNIAQRRVIRSTWGSVARTKTWPLSNKTFDGLKLLFISGNKDAGNMSDPIGQQMQEEMETFGDIVLIDFKDSYTNLTIKMIMAFKWIHQFCPYTNYILKVDEDSFAHVPNILQELQSEGNDSRCQVRGHILRNPIVNRFGKWKVSHDVYPFYRYPLYTSGTSYVVSGKIVNKLLYSAEHMPLIPNEDAFITGVLRVAVGAELCHTGGFTFRADPKPELCSFQNNRRKVATNTDNSLKIELWKSLHDVGLQDCYTRYIVFRIPDYDMDKWLTQKGKLTQLLKNQTKK